MHRLLGYTSQPVQSEDSNVMHNLVTDIHCNNTFRHEVTTVTIILSISSIIRVHYILMLSYCQASQPQTTDTDVNERQFITTGY